MININKTIDYLESNLIDPQIRGSNKDFIYKTVQLDESTALSVAYLKNRFVNARIAIKNEDAESINQDSTTWLNVQVFQSYYIFCMAYRDLSSDDNIDIYEDDGTNQFKQNGTIPVSTILERLQQREYTKIITKDVKTTGKPM